MENKQTPNFVIGFLIGLLLCVILWYWQKSTAAEDGALALLDRFAANRQAGGPQGEREAEPEPEKEKEKETAVAQTPFDFTPIKGIGTVFNQRLHEAGITSLAALLNLAADSLTELLNIGPNRAQAILDEARTHA